MNTYEIEEEMYTVLGVFFNQDTLKKEYLILKEEQKRVIDLIDNIHSCEDFDIAPRNKTLLFTAREYYRVRINLITDMIEDEAWLYSNLT